MFSAGEEVFAHKPLLRNSTRNKDRICRSFFVLAGGSLLIQTESLKKTDTSFADNLTLLVSGCIANLSYRFMVILLGPIFHIARGVNKHTSSTLLIKKDLQMRSFLYSLMLPHGPPMVV